MDANYGREEVSALFKFLQAGQGDGPFRSGEDSLRFCLAYPATARPGANMANALSPV